VWYPKSPLAARLRSRLLEGATLVSVLVYPVLTFRGPSLDSYFSCPGDPLSSPPLSSSVVRTPLKSTLFCDAGLVKGSKSSMKAPLRLPHLTGVGLSLVMFSHKIRIRRCPCPGSWDHIRNSKVSSCSASHSPLVVRPASALLILITANIQAGPPALRTFLCGSLSRFRIHSV